MTSAGPGLRRLAYRRTRPKDVTAAYAEFVRPPIGVDQRESPLAAMATVERLPQASAVGLPRALPVGEKPRRKRLPNPARAG